MYYLVSRNHIFNTVAYPVTLYKCSMCVNIACSVNNEMLVETILGQVSECIYPIIIIFLINLFAFSSS